VNETRRSSRSDSLAHCSDESSEKRSDTTDTARF
jgi:hypothetical protein